jgi:hypothetical protein
MCPCDWLCCLFMSISMLRCIHVWICVGTPVDILYVCICVCIHTRIYVYKNVLFISLGYMHTYIHTYTHTMQDQAGDISATQPTLLQDVLPFACSVCTYVRTNDHMYVWTCTLQFAYTRTAARYMFPILHAHCVHLCRNDHYTCAHHIYIYTYITYSV